MKGTESCIYVLEKTSRNLRKTMQQLIFKQAVTLRYTLKSYLNLVTNLQLIIITNSGQQECQFCSGKFAEIHKIMVHSVSLQ